MIRTIGEVVYQAFGLKIVSTIRFPELPQINSDVSTADIKIETEDLSEKWKDLNPMRQKFVIHENLVMFQVPHAAIFSIQEGKKIIFSPVSGVAEDKIRLYLLGTCMGALLMQRKTLPLHGSVIAIEGKAYALVGDSGAGKSTLATAFLNKGYRFLSDDVIAVAFSHGNNPFIIPSYPQQKLWQDSLDKFGMEKAEYHPLFDREKKYVVPVHAQFHPTSLPFAGLIELVKTENEEVRMFRIQGMKRFHTVFKHTFRNFLIEQLGLMDWHFTTSGNIVKQIDIFQLQRPISRFSVQELVSIILSSLENGGDEMDNAKKISLQCQIVQSKGNIVSDMDGEKVMLNVQKGKYYNLGEIGGEIWDAISKPIQVNQLIDLLLSNYNIGQLECENQVLPYLDRLVHENIIHIVEESHT